MNKIKFLISFILLSLALSPSNSWSREQITISEEKQISIISDKALREGDNEVFQAIGNVIITHQEEAIYGEAAELNIETGEVTVEGSVRYITDTAVMYGSKIVYNFNSKKLAIYNARIINGDMTILGSYIAKTGPNEMRATKAEFSTCRDCPESWSIYGEDVVVTLDQYITIKHGLLKAVGVPILYIPYLVFPIKKKRQSGLLFPEFKTTSTASGLVYRQPFFWAISDNKDATISPSVFGKRGYGTTLEYRHILGDKKWFEFDGLGVFDRIYDPHYVRDEEKEVDYFRYFGSYEHHFQFGNWLNHHLSFTDLRDLDVHRDYNDETKDFQLSSDDGVSTYFDIHTNWLSIAAEGHFRKNQLVQDPREFDHSYVQILPKISMSLVPMAAIQSDIPFFNHIGGGIDLDYTNFTQNRTLQGDYYRNAQRANIRPYINWHLFNLGPVHFQSNLEGEYQRYNLPHAKPTDKGGDEFKKKTNTITTTASLEIEKIFGLAYSEKLNVRDVNFKDRKEAKKYAKKNIQLSPDIIGTLPELQSGLTEDYVLMNVNSYKHLQEIKLSHIFTTNSELKGNEDFRQQIEASEGLFDYLDTIREEQNLIGSVSQRTDLPTKNTIELQWNNSLIRKSSSRQGDLKDGKFLKDNFSYSKIAFFNISQGIELAKENVPFKDRLTRLYVNTGLSLKKFTISVSEFFFYQSSSHVLSLNFSQTFDRFDYTASVVYNSLVENTSEKLKVEIGYTPFDAIKLATKQTFDLRSQKDNTEEYNITYLPSNKCWQLDFSYYKTEIDSKAALNFKLLIDNYQNAFF